MFCWIKNTAFLLNINVIKIIDSICIVIINVIGYILIIINVVKIVL